MTVEENTSCCRARCRPGEILMELFGCKPYVKDGLEIPGSYWSLVFALKKPSPWPPIDADELIEDLEHQMDKAADAFLQLLEGMSRYYAEELARTSLDFQPTQGFFTKVADEVFSRGGPWADLILNIELEDPVRNELLLCLLRSELRRQSRMTRP